MKHPTVYDRLQRLGGKLLTAIKNPFTARDRGEKRMAQLIGPWSASRYGSGRSWDQFQQVAHYRSWVARCVEFLAEGVRTPPRIVRVLPQINGQSFGMAVKEWRAKNALKREPRPFPDEFRRKVLTKVRQKAAVGPIDSDEEYEFMPDDHPAVRLMNDPNAPQTGVKFWQLMGTYEELTGNSFVWIVENGAGQPVELWILPSQWVTPICTGLTGRLVDWYEVRAVNGPVQVFEPEEIMWSKNDNPWHPLMVSSRVQQAATTIDAYEMTEAARYAGMENGLMAGGVFSYPADVNVTEAMANRLRDKLLAQYGGPQNAGRPLIVDGGLEWTPPTGELELAFLQSSDQLRKFIMAQFGLDDSMMGFSDSSTYAAAVITEKSLFKRVFSPRMENRAALLTERLLPRFGPDLRAIYVPDTTTEDPDARRADWQVAVGANAVTVNEIRTELLGLEPMDDPSADELPQDPLMSAAGWDEEGNPIQGGEGDGEFGGDVPRPSKIPAFGESGGDEEKDDKGLVNRIALNGKH